MKQSMDDFHVHDAGTRDFLEWLDDDDKHKESSVGGDVLDISGEEKLKSSDEKGFDEDDFDFDQMLAEADVSSSLKSPQQSNQGSDVGSSVSQKRQVQHNQSALKTEKARDISVITSPVKEPVAEETTSSANMPSEAPRTVESRNSQLSSGTITPEPISKPYVSACIEEELSFDSWNDETDDFQNAVIEGDDNTGPATEVNVGTAPMDSSKSGSTVTSPAKGTFTTLAEAVRSSTATIDDVRALLNRETGRSNTHHDVGVSLEDRPYLWTKVICGKVLGELDNGSLADSFREWQKQNEKIEKYISKACEALIEQMRLEAGNNTSGVDEDLLSVLAFSSTKDSDAPTKEIDPLIPPVAYAILQSGIPPAAASVVLSQIEPSAMPLLRLSQSERHLAVKNLHMDFYLLACYHLPLLVMHLDRQCPGWYWPENEKTNDEPSETELVVTASHDRSKHSFESGVIPLTWFITNFAGELGKSCLDHQVLLPLWDYALTTGDCSRKFFLAIAVLDKHSDSLLMSRGEELKTELEKVLSFKAHSFDEESFVSEWLSLAQSLADSTPTSVINMLRSTDDRAVTDALTAKKVAMEEKAKAQLEAEEAAKKKERDERDAEAKKALTRARLVSYYRGEWRNKDIMTQEIFSSLSFISVIQIHTWPDHPYPRTQPRKS